MAHSADLHNFGQRVKTVARASGNFYQKPRTLFWEWLFFGADSPLKIVIGRDDRSPLSGLFRLEVEFTGPDFCGQVREVVEEPALHRDPAGCLEQFGALLGYCYAFGIRDLHRFNLVRLSTGGQVIDAEVVFAKLLLPHETLLLPFKDIAFQEAGIGALVPTPDDLTPDLCIHLFRGYTAALSGLADHVPEILSCIEGENARMARAPVRHIIRDTHRYRNWREQQAQEMYLPEEITQLERGDIPYFFKFIGQPELWYHASFRGDPTRVEVPGRYADAVNREARHPSDLIAERRIRHELLPVGLLFLARTLLPGLWTGDLDLGGRAGLRCKLDRLELSTSHGAYGASRHRASIA